MRKQKIVWFLVIPVKGTLDEEGNIVGVEQMQGSLVYHPFALSLAEAAAIINQQFEEKAD